MNIGDLVQYRAWREGDRDRNSIPKESQFWGKTGLVVEICDWKEKGITYPGEAVIVSTSEGFNECRHRDLGIIK
jgi:hypothetical protein